MVKDMTRFHKRHLGGGRGMHECMCAGFHTGF